jgi:predicted RecB family endonuclease
VIPHFMRRSWEEHRARLRIPGISCPPLNDIFVPHNRCRPHCKEHRRLAALVSTDSAIFQEISYAMVRQAYIYEEMVRQRPISTARRLEPNDAARPSKTLGPETVRRAVVRVAHHFEAMVRVAHHCEAMVRVAHHCEAMVRVAHHFEAMDQLRSDGTRGAPLRSDGPISKRWYAWRTIWWLIILS